MAISNPVKNASGNWVVTIGQNGSAASKTLSTKNTYVDGDIILNEEVGAAATLGASVSIGDTNVTPKVDVSTNESGKTADSYGIVTSTSGLNKYVTLDPGATVTEGSATPTATTTASGWATKNSTTATGTATSTSTVIGDGQNKYVPAFTDGGITVDIVRDKQTDPKTDTKATITVPAGITSGFTKVVRVNLLPDIPTPATEDWIRSGYSAYNDQGDQIDGAMGNAVLAAAGSVTVSGSKKDLQPSSVTITDPDATVSGKTRIDVDFATGTTSISKYFITAAGTSAAIGDTNVAVSGTGTATASVTTAGYAAGSLTGTGSVSGSGNAVVAVKAKTGSTYYAPIDTIGLSANATVSGSGSVTPSGVSIAQKTVPTGVTNAATSDAPTTTAPTSGVYVAIAGTSASGSGSASLSGTATASVASAGYGTNETGTGSFTGTASITLNSKAGSTYYQKIKTGSATPTADLLGATGLTDTIDVNSKQFTVTPKATVGTAGWISSISNGTAQKYEVISAQLSGTGSVSTTSSNVTLAESSSAPSSGFYVTSTGSGTVNVTQPGWIQSDTSGGSATKYYSLPTSTISSTGSVTTAPKVTVSGAATGMATSSTATSYYVTVSGTPANGTVQTKYTAAEGYTSGATDAASGTVTVTPTAAGSGTKVYIKESALTIGSSSTFDPVVAPGTVSVAR